MRGVVVVVVVVACLAGEGAVAGRTRRQLGQSKPNGGDMSPCSNAATADKQDKPPCAIDTVPRWLRPRPANWKPRPRPPPAPPVYLPTPIPPVKPICPPICPDHPKPTIRAFPQPLPVTLPPKPACKSVTEPTTTTTTTQAPPVECITQPPTLPPTPVPTTSVPCCSKPHVFSGCAKMVNQDSHQDFGEMNTLHNLPSFAAIMETFPHPPGSEMNELLCGGSLIHERVVLTAAHCVLAIEPHRLDNLEVALGAWDTKEGWLAQVRQVTKVVHHPSYKGNTLQHNMALLLLNQSVEVTSHVKPICLGPVQSPSSCVAVGWSKTGDLSNIKVPVLDRETCEGCLKNMNEYEASAICPSLFCTSTTGFHDKSSGSPLLCKDPADGNYWQSGVLVSQLPCTQAFYVNATQELDWITRETSDLIHYGMVP